MNNPKMVKDFLCQHLPVEQLANKYQISIRDVFDGIRKFMKVYSNTSLFSAVSKRYKAEILRLYVSTHLTMHAFAESIGLSESAFYHFMMEAIEDYSLISSDGLADRLYRKTMDYRTIKYTQMPPRIIKCVAAHYLKDKHNTMTSVGSIYNISKGTVGNIIRRGISEDILDEQTCDLIFAKVRNCSPHTPSDKVIGSYDAAFDKRAQVQTNKKIQKLEALLESDDPNIDRAEIEAILKKLKG